MYNKVLPLPAKLVKSIIEIINKKDNLQQVPQIPITPVTNSLIVLDKQPKNNHITCDMKCVYKMIQKIEYMYKLLNNDKGFIYYYRLNRISRFINQLHVYCQQHNVQITVKKSIIRLPRSFKFKTYYMYTIAHNGNYMFRLSSY